MMTFRVSKIEETPFGNREPLIDKMCFAPVMPEPKEGEEPQPPPAQHLEAHRCHSVGAPSVGDVYCLLPVEHINALRLENLSLQGLVKTLEQQLSGKAPE